ncbi:heterokaryon incompatibility protein-domain-containing protein [Apiospora arundinis]
MTSEYVYAPLDLSKDSLRLLCLCKGRPGAQIRCQVFQSLLSESEGIPYEALSYTWGAQPTDNSPCILLDGQKFPVTTNLFDALNALRLCSLDRLLWVDALCINQRDHREKGHQVGQMGSVYWNADTVLVWLEPSSDDIDDLMTLPNLEASWSATVAQLEDARKVVYKRHASAFAQVLARSAWFKRVWIIQEVANARAAVIICGSKSVSSRIFSTMPHLMQLEIDPNTRAVFDVMPGPLRKQSWWNADRRSITLLTKFHGSEATQEHDRIYALLGYRIGYRCSRFANRL